MKKSLLTILCVSGAVLAGCGDSARDDFVKGCVADQGMNEAFCECMADEVKKEVGVFPPGVIFKRSSEWTEAEAKEIAAFEKEHADAAAGFRKAAWGSLNVCGDKLKK